jgi:aspartate-semialdehyde dehydrogenase
MDVAIVGATGIVGQQFIVALQNHPWFNIKKLLASERSAGKLYKDAITHSGIFSWYCDEKPKDEILNMKVELASEFNPNEVNLIFTAIESDEARIIEPKFAKHRPVISTASAFRYEKDVPILVPGINDEHTKLLDIQKSSRGWEGFITPIPNCTTTGLVVTLKPLEVEFGLDTVIMTSLQAVSGAGRTNGVLALDIIDNIIPYIPKEEEKVMRETKKILGSFNNGEVKPLEVKVSCTCTRVNVRDGHTESVFVSAKRYCNAELAKKAMRNYANVLNKYNLPSAPKELIVILEDKSRPQPRLDRDTYDGMATVVGRIRDDEALPNGVKYVLVSHNTKMGAAKGAVLVAELLHNFGYIKG